MNSNFEPIVAETYVSLCVQWRQASVHDKMEAAGLEAKLASLEAVIQSFGFKTPTGKPEPRTRTTRPAGARQNVAPQQQQPQMQRGQDGVALGD